MPGLTRKLPVWLPILVLLIAMSSHSERRFTGEIVISSVGAPGVTALRLALGTLILIAFSNPRRLRFAKEQRLAALLFWRSVAGRDELSILSVDSDGAVGYWWSRWNLPVLAVALFSYPGGR